VSKPAGPLPSADSSLTLRTALRPADAPEIQRIVRATGMFTDAECDVAMELVHDHLARGEAGGYAFVVAERGGDVIGYAAFGPIPCTLSSYDLYWIAVDPAWQGQGAGRALLRAAEAHAERSGATRMYLDTAGREAYAPTRAFYERCGYAVAAVLEDFYAPGDAKVIYVRALRG